MKTDREFFKNKPQTVDELWDAVDQIRRDLSDEHMGTLQDLHIRMAREKEDFERIMQKLLRQANVIEHELKEQA